jgi:hypothetical protein
MDRFKGWTVADDKAAEGQPMEPREEYGNLHDEADDTANTIFNLLTQANVQKPVDMDADKVYAMKLIVADLQRAKGRLDQLMKG